MSVIRPVLHHVTIKTSRLDEMVAWYGKVVGCTVTFKDANNAWTTNDDANHRIAFLSVPALTDDPAKVQHNGMHHSAFEYASFDDLMSSYARMRDDGIRPAFCLDHGMTFSLYYRDPEGNYVELQSDSYGDWKKSTQWMSTSPDFAANPIGYFFDAERVYGAYKSGMEYGVLQTAIRNNEFAPVPIPNIGLPV